jgi:hypothetical protein
MGPRVIQQQRRESNMNPAANDWASPSVAQNITISEADRFANQLAAAVAVQFGDRFVKTTAGEIVPEVELKQNGGQSVPVNLWGSFAGVAPVPMNIAELRSRIRSAALAENPVGELESILHQALPQVDPQVTILRAPAIQSAVRTLLAQF